MFFRNVIKSVSKSVQPPVKRRPTLCYKVALNEEMFNCVIHHAGVTVWTDFYFCIKKPMITSYGSVYNTILKRLELDAPARTEGI